MWLRGHSPHQDTGHGGYELTDARRTLRRGFLICSNHKLGAWLTARANRHDALQPLALFFFSFARLLRRNLGKDNRVPLIEGAYFVKVFVSRLRRIWLSRFRRIWLSRLRRIWLNGDRSGFRRGVGGANRRGGRLLRLGRRCVLRDVSHARQEIVVDRERVCRNRSLEHAGTAARTEPIVQGETKDIILIVGGL